jgi:DNA-binding NarL/FixJ family response regulator
MSACAVVELRPATIPTRGDCQVIPFPGTARPADGAGVRQIELLVAHGQPLMRAALELLLAGEQEIAVTAVAADADEAVAAARRHRPDVVLMHIDLPGRGAIEATRRMLADARPAALKVVILAPSDREGQARDVLRAGASGVLLESAEPTDLSQAVGLAARGRALFTQPTRGFPLRERRWNYVT